MAPVPVLKLDGKLLVLRFIERYSDALNLQLQSPRQVFFRRPPVGWARGLGKGKESIEGIADLGGWRALCGSPAPAFHEELPDRIGDPVEGSRGSFPRLHPLQHQGIAVPEEWDVPRQDLEDRREI